MISLIFALILERKVSHVPLIFYISASFYFPGRGAWIQFAHVTTAKACIGPFEIFANCKEVIWQYLIPTEVTSFFSIPFLLISGNFILPFKKKECRFYSAFFFWCIQPILHLPCTKLLVQYWFLFRKIQGSHCQAASIGWTGRSMTIRGWMHHARRRRRQWFFFLVGVLSLLCNLYFENFRSHKRRQLMMREFSSSVAQPSRVVDTCKEEKTIIEDPAEVGLGGEAPMLKLAKNLYIFQIERDFS